MMNKGDKNNILSTIIAVVIMAVFIFAGVMASKSGHKEEIDSVMLILQTICDSMLGILIALGGVIIICAIIKGINGCSFVRETMEESNKQQFIENNQKDEIYVLKSRVSVDNKWTTLLICTLLPAMVIIGAVITLEDFSLVYGPVIDIPMLKVIVVTICFLMFTANMSRAMSIKKMGTGKIVSAKKLKEIKAKLAALKKNGKNQYIAYYEYMIDGHYHLHRECCLHKESEKASMAPYTTYSVYYSEEADVALTDKEREYAKKSTIKCIISVLAAILILFIRDPFVLHFSLF